MLVRATDVLSTFPEGSRNLGTVDSDGRTIGAGHDVEVEDLGRNPDGGAHIGHIDDAADMALNRRRTQQRVSLITMQSLTGL